MSLTSLTLGDALALGLLTTLSEAIALICSMMGLSLRACNYLHLLLMGEVFDHLE
ncbi:hypothetical protein OG21DRAFT_1492133 [Imleria badia]|nr:hypothetical protein OG21DRAFT_1492133 [Imleria badia]